MLIGIVDIMIKDIMILAYVCGLYAYSKYTYRFI